MYAIRSYYDMLYDIMIYDNRDNLNKNSNVTLADSGKLQVAGNKAYMQLTIFDGVRFDEKVDTKHSRIKNRDKQRFRIDHFKKQVVIKKMEGYNLERTDEKLFTHSDKMKNYSQLRYDKDSLIKMRDTVIMNLSHQTKNAYFVKQAIEKQHKKEHYTP